MDIVQDLSIFKQIAVGVKKKEKATAGAVAIDKIDPWQATADPRHPTTPPTGTNNDSKAIRLLDIKDMNVKISFKTTPDDMLFNFLQAAENPTVNNRNIIHHASKILYFDNHTAGQWAINRWNPMDTSNQIESQLPYFMARKLTKHIVEFFIYLDHFCATNNVKDKTRIHILINTITKDEQSAVVQIGINSDS
jgi:hypothetical protein